MTDRDGFFRFWHARYRETPPVNFVFKHRLPGRWVRIHSLPRSKRYPETPAEWRTLLDRQNEVICHLIPEGRLVKIVFNGLDAGPGDELVKEFDLVDAGTVDYEAGSPPMPIHVGTLVWTPGTLDSLLDPNLGGGEAVLIIG